MFDFFDTINMFDKT